MKPRIYKVSIDEYRQWCVIETYRSSAAYFPTWQTALEFALKCPRYGFFE